jgi:large subunit ribosomal protein L17
MRHRSKTKILDRKKAPRTSLLKSLAESVILYEKVKTTEAKAKAVRTLVEQSITSSKNPTLAARRKLVSTFHTQLPVKKLIEVLGPRYKDRKGGYTRIVKIGPRKNDAAMVVQIELV